jgi:hypothetical protein
LKKGGGKERSSRKGEITKKERKKGRKQHKPKMKEQIDKFSFTILSLIGVITKRMKNIEEEAEVVLLNN